MTPTPEERSISQLVGDLLAELSKLVQNEIDLARAELSDKVAIAGEAAKLIAAGAVLLIPGIVLILFEHCRRTDPARMVSAACLSLLRRGGSDHRRRFGVGGDVPPVRKRSDAVGDPQRNSTRHSHGDGAHAMNEEKIASGGDFVRDLGVAIRDNPVPAALIGMGLAWLFTGGRSSARAGFDWARGSVTNLTSKAGETANGLGRSFNDTAGENRGAGSAVAQKAADVVSSLGTTTPQFFASAQANIADLMRRQPLMLGAVGLAIGAGIAASLRTTDAEANLLGEASKNVQERAREFAATAAQRANDVSAAISEEARAQQLTPDGIRQVAGEANRKIESVIDRSAERVRSRLN